mgnify:FL=1
MAKILHTADFHLDSAFTALPEEKARLRRQEARQLTDRLVDYANDHGVELLLLAGDLSSKDIVPLMVEMFEFIRDYKGEVPGASPKDCGNYLDMNLGMANYLAKRYLDHVLYNIDDSRLVYPE